MKDRILYLDILRIFAILSMIFLHAAASEWDITPVNSYGWQLCNAYESLVRYCVPIFFMVSGCLFLNPDKKIDIKKLYSKNILRIVTAFLFWSALYASISIIKVVLRQEQITGDVKMAFAKELLSGSFHMWFMYAIIGLYITVPVLRKITEEKKIEEYFLIASFLVGILIPMLQRIPGLAVTTVITDNMKLFLFSGFTFYFILGHYIHTYQIMRKYRLMIYILGAFAAIVTMLGTSLISLDNEKALQTFFGYLTPNVAFQAIAVFVFIKTFSEKWNLSGKTQRTIIKVSNLSFGIYLVHVLVARMLAAIGLDVFFINPIFSVPIITVINFTISFMIVLIISKIPILNKYIM